MSKTFRASFRTHANATSKFSAAFDAVFAGADIRIIRTPV